MKKRIIVFAAILCLAACTSGAEVSDEAPVIGGSDESVEDTTTDSDESTSSDPAPTATSVPEPTETPQPEPTAAPTAVPAEPTADTREEPAEDSGEDEEVDPALAPVTGRYADLGCVNGLVGRIAMADEGVGEIMDEIPFQVWACPGTDEILSELLCYVEETAQAVDELEQLSETGSLLAARLRERNTVFCYNPVFSESINN